MARKLTAKQEAFVREYAKDWNATQAAIRAGFAPKAAGSQAAQLLVNPKVAKEITVIKARLAKRAEVRAERVLVELKSLAHANLLDYAEWGNCGVRLKESTALTRAKAAGLVEVRQTKDGVVIKLANKVQALELLGKHIGLWDGRGSKDGESQSEEYVVTVRRADEQQATNESAATEPQGDEDAE